jgi:biopolymer transport protein ExbD
MYLFADFHHSQRIFGQQAVSNGGSEATMWKPSQARVRRERKRNTTLYTGIHVAGFAGVLVALLFMFLAHSLRAPDLGPYLGKVMAVDLPKDQNATWQPGALREDFMWIVVTRDGVVYFRRNRIHDEIPDVMRAALHDGSEKKVYPSVDTYGRYAKVKVVLGQIRLAGVSDVVFLAEKLPRAAP